MSELGNCRACEKLISDQAEVCVHCGHPIRKDASGWISKTRALLTTILAIIGLSGLADGFVEWREFFEIGFMEHYRAIKVYLLLWVPFDVPFWMPDYFVVGSSLFTSFIISKLKIALDYNRLRIDHAIFEWKKMDILLLFILCVGAWPLMYYFMIFSIIAKTPIHIVANPNLIFFPIKNEDKLIIKQKKQFQATLFENLRIITYSTVMVFLLIDFSTNYFGVLL